MERAEPLPGSGTFPDLPASDRTICGFDLGEEVVGNLGQGRESRTRLRRQLLLQSLAFARAGGQLPSKTFGSLGTGADPGRYQPVFGIGGRIHRV